ncbi:acyl-CoA N-acyltransferase [Exidia glandulosa HHB12029]|uniref:Acyl-CoA N-acyltransferase n=1 Tax=Exidia glandulosa HHB12029 TaxID=1314781 RepID=A0A165E9U5_EXIGL|nr:acyl-CoA N-acyltransferase [Exidia glandulosa HHB12029]
MPYAIHQLVSPKEEVVLEVIAALDAAFPADEDDIGKALFGDNTTVEAMNHAVNTSQVTAGLLGGEVWVAEDDESHEILAVSVWLPPGRTMYDTDEKREKALLPLINAMPSDAADWFDKTSHTMDEAKRRAVGDAQKTEWYLHRIGVKPGQRGRGLGKALIAAVANKAHGRVVTLETKSDTNVRFYEKVGFEKKGSLEMDAPHGRFTIHWMAMQC